MGTAFASHIVKAAIEYAELANSSLFLLYVDLEKAFDRVCRELLFGFPAWVEGCDTAREQHLLGLGLSQRAAQFVIEMLRNEGPLLVRWGVPLGVVNLLLNLHDGSWFEIADALDIVVGKTGGRQGCKVGALVFNSIYAKAMAHVKSRMCAIGASCEVSSADCAFWACGDHLASRDDSVKLKVTDATFVDDVCAISIRRQASALDKIIPLIIQAFVLEFDKMGLTINFAPGKTECMVKFRGRDAQKILNQRVTSGKLVYNVNGVDGELVAVNIVQSYKHLGLVTSFSAADTADARRKARSAMSAYTPLAVRIFGSPSIYLSTKLSLFESLIQSRLLFNVQLMYPRRANIKQLNGPYMRVVRRIFDDLKGADMKYSDISLRTRYGVPSVDCLMQRCRLRYIATIFRSDPTELKGMLALKVNGRSLPWVEMILNDLKVLRPFLCTELGGDIGDPAVYHETWVAVMRFMRDKWRRAVERIFFTSSICDPVEKLNSTSDTSAFQCEECGLAFFSKKALGMHNRVVHNLRCQARLYIGPDPVCPVCRATFESRLRAIAHLSDPRRTRCLDKLVPEMRFDEAVVHELDELDKRERAAARREGHTRPLAPSQARRSDGKLLGRATPV